MKRVLSITKMIMATIMTTSVVMLMVGLLAMDKQLINFALVMFFGTIGLGLTSILVYINLFEKTSK